MVNWQSPTELVADANAFDKFMHALLGLYAWEVAVSVGFDVAVITGKKRFRWPMMFYFMGRYFLLFALIGIVVALDVTTEVNCQALYVFNQVMGNAAIGLASINLSLRTMAVWSQSLYIVVPLVAVILGHWSLLLHGLLIKAAWVPGQGCIITNTDNKLLAATFIYGMCFDFLVLCLTAYKLMFPGTGRSRLVKLIFNDGLIFFIVAFLSNVIATVFMLMNLNAVMSIIFNVPAAVASTIVASRAVRRLTKFTTKGPEMFSAGQGSTLAFRGSAPMRAGGTIKKNGSVGVHVQMDTFTLAESNSIPNGQSFVEYDATGKVKNDSYEADPEAQEISDDFKRPPY